MQVINNMATITFSNVRIYYMIAKEAYDEMKADEKKRIRLKPNGETGYIQTPDFNQKGFKRALVTIVFCCTCLESLLHLLIGKYFGHKECKQTDKFIYEDKLAILGCKDDKIFDDGEYLRKVRKEILHEKGYLNKGKIRIAQKEAEKSIIALDSICQFFKIQLIN